MAELPRYARDMDPIERAFTEAMHDIGCGDGKAFGIAEQWDQPGKPHPLEDHEPFDVEEGEIPWATMAAAFRKRGLLLVDVAHGPWAIPDVVRRLIDMASHTLVAHNCDYLGHEEVKEASEAGRAWLQALLEADISAQVGERAVELKR